MRTLSDLVSDIKAEIRDVPVNNKLVLNILGIAVQEKTKELIGTHQIFWQDLADSTVDSKRKKNQGKGNDPSSPLYATGDFERSIEYKVIGQNKVQIFSDDPTAEYHEYGTVNQPPRPVFKPAALLVLKEFLGKRRISEFYLKRLR